MLLLPVIKEGKAANADKLNISTSTATIQTVNKNATNTQVRASLIREWLQNEPIVLFLYLDYFEPKKKHTKTTVGPVWLAFRQFISNT